MGSNVSLGRSKTGQERVGSRWMKMGRSAGQSMLSESEVKCRVVLVMMMVAPSGEPNVV